MNIVSINANDPQHDERHKLACVGDSLTFGYGLLDKDRHSYPSRLASLLGESWEIRNFGINGACATEGVSDFYLNNEIGELKNWNAECVMLMLGSNDSKEIIWNGGDAYAAGLDRILDALEVSPDKVILIAPPPCGPNLFGIRSDVIDKEIIPRLHEYSQSKGTGMIDFNDEMKGKFTIFIDNIHLNRKGYEIFTELLFRDLEEAELLNGKGSNRELTRN